MTLDPLYLASGAGGALFLALILLSLFLRKEKTRTAQSLAQNEFLLELRVREHQTLEEQLLLSKQALEEAQTQLHLESLGRVAAETQAQQLPALHSRIEALQYELAHARDKATELEVTLTQEQQKTQEKLILLNEAEQKLANTFKALSADVLAQSNKSFLHLAQTTLGKYQEQACAELVTREKAIATLLDPVRQTLNGVGEKLGELEKARLGAYEVLRHQVHDLIAGQKELRLETANLVKALRAPSVRGRWGEMQLRRVVEITGLSSHCDFREQVDMQTSEGRLRPDMVVNLAGGKHIVIDSKVPLAAYLDALEASDDKTRQDFMRAHARHVHNHIAALSSRAYWEQFPLDASPEFVVLFLPGEIFFSAALEYDPDLIERGVEKKVLLTTPTSLIALLHTVAYGWRQERLTANAREISELGRELYKRLSDMGMHITKLGQSLGGAVRNFNQAIGTLERRVLPSARRFKDLDVGSARHDLEVLQSLDLTPRDLQAPELLSDSLEESEEAPALKRQAL